VLAFLDRLRAWIERVGYVMGCAGGWLSVVCAFFITLDVLGRKFFGVSSKATVELTGYMLAFGIAWGLTDALTTRCHIRVDVLVTRMPQGLRAYMHALALAFLVVLNFFFVWRGWAVVAESWMFGAHDSSAITTPLIIPQGLWAAGMTVFLFLSVTMLLEVIVLLVLGERERVDRLLGPRTLAEETAEALDAAAIATRE
jgi:TRAP-type mannitol/chloroaromatic compound transport system permease small subunit